MTAPGRLPSFAALAAELDAPRRLVAERGGLIQLTSAAADGELRVGRLSPLEPGERERPVRRAKLLAWAGNAWHLVEFVIAVGAGIAAGSIATMPLLARAKRRVGRQLNSAATVSEAAQNQICAYLSIALLVGLLANALLGWWWADPAAALVIAGLAGREGWESWKGESCDCC